MEEAVQAGEEWKAAVLERGKQDREKMRQEEEERLRVARLQVLLFAVMVVCVRLGTCLCAHTCVCASVHMFMHHVSPPTHIRTKFSMQVFEDQKKAMERAKKQPALPLVFDMGAQADLREAGRPDVAVVTGMIVGGTTQEIDETTREVKLDETRATHGAQWSTFCQGVHVCACVNAPLFWYLKTLDVLSRQRFLSSGALLCLLVCACEADICAQTSPHITPIR